MPYSIQLHNSLDKVSTKHKALALKFQEFARFVKDCTQTPSVANQSITVSLQSLDKGFFTTTFASRTVSFVFTSFLQESDDLVGNVQCFILKEFPETRQIKFGEFNFDEAGHTNLKLQNEDAQIDIAGNFGTFHIALHFIRASLSN